jgi:pimeloyl-ACP methyl ester carboxylesterase
VGETIVLLHGFPSYAQSWESVATKLAAQNFRVLALEQRGYSVGAQPKKTRSYVIDELTGDVAALLRAANVKSAHIVGHDWGGAVAWAFADAYPEQTLSLSSISTPHPRAFKKALCTSRQLAMSWYMFFFQLPFLPELMLRANKGKRVLTGLVGSGLNKTTAGAYTTRLLGGDNLHSALAWYRALRFGSSGPSTSGIKARTLFIYGGKDTYLSKKSARLTRSWVTGAYTFKYLPQATHWIPEEQPDLLVNELVTFIKHSQQS